jgi:hypothetical protein
MVLVACLAVISPFMARWALRRLRVTLRRSRRTVARLPRAQADDTIVDLAAYRARREAHVRLVPRAAPGVPDAGTTVAPPVHPGRARSKEHLA